MAAPSHRRSLRKRRTLAVSAAVVAAGVGAGVLVRGATHVWADRNTFTDAPGLDRNDATYYGRQYQIHDGDLDITNGSDLVTVERNQFTDRRRLRAPVSVNSRAKAQVVAENNFWKVPSGGKVAKLLSGDGTGSIAGSGNLVNGTATDLVAVYDAANSKKIKTTVNWTPTLTAGLESATKNLPAELATTTGAGVLK